MRRERERSCEECPCPIFNAGTSTVHNVCQQCQNPCQGSRQKKRWSAAQSTSTYPASKYETQSVTFAPGPLGRPLDDPRNNPRNNEKRRDGSFLNPVRVAVLDIETSGLNAGFGVVLCAVVKLYGPDERKIFRADEYEPWKTGQRANDAPLLRDILSCLEDADIIIAHNGLKFDLPFLRTRAVIHGLPPVNFQKIIDPVQLARQHFRFAGNSLDSISKTIGTQEKKTPLSPEVWQRATLNGDADAMETIVTHCVADVDVLEEICWKLRGYIRTIDRAGSFRG